MNSLFLSNIIEYGFIIVLEFLANSVPITFFHFTYLNILEGNIVRIYGKYFSIAAWGKSGGYCDNKVAETYKKTTMENGIDE